MVCACWQWRTFGFLQFPRLFAPDEIGWITEEFEKVVPGGDNDMESEAAADIHGKENVRPARPSIVCALLVVCWPRI